jgi:hypothetical protein
MDVFINCLRLSTTSLMCCDTSLQIEEPWRQAASIPLRRHEPGDPEEVVVFGRPRKARGWNIIFIVVTSMAILALAATALIFGLGSYEAADPST